MPAFAAQHPALVAAVLLTASNLFMTFAWYGHLKHLNDRPWWIAAVLSWGIALFEYLLQVPANRVGFTVLSLAQLKICLLYTSPSPRDRTRSRMPSSA